MTLASESGAFLSTPSSTWLFLLVGDFLTECPNSRA
jgi:hypothetical protein